jgi:hypothetical protein
MGEKSHTQAMVFESHEREREVTTPPPESIEPRGVKGDILVWFAQLEN